MNPLIAFCGLDCTKCEAYIATQANDVAAQEQLLIKWRQEYNSPDMPIDAVTCDGCTSAGRLGGYCSACPIRACSVSRQMTNCAYCPDYASCEKLAHFFDLARMPKSRWMRSGSGCHRSRHRNFPLRDQNPSDVLNTEGFFLVARYAPRVTPSLRSPLARK